MEKDILDDMKDSLEKESELDNQRLEQNAESSSPEDERKKPKSPMKEYEDEKEKPHRKRKPGERFVVSSDRSGIRPGIRSVEEQVDLLRKFQEGDNHSGDILFECYQQMCFKLSHWAKHRGILTWEEAYEHCLLSFSIVIHGYKFRGDPINDFYLPSFLKSCMTYTLLHEEEKKAKILHYECPQEYIDVFEEMYYNPADEVCDEIDMEILIEKHFTEQQQRIMEYLRDGWKRCEIAKELELSPRTIYNEVKRIEAKLSLLNLTMH